MTCFYSITTGLEASPLLIANLKFDTFDLAELDFDDPTNVSQHLDENWSVKPSPGI
jgi:hypothetical protein